MVRSTTSEAQIHKAIVSYLNLEMTGGWLWFHPANGEARTPQTGAKLKAMGVRPGIPDLVFVSPNGRVHFMEIKRPGAVLNLAQRQIADWCEARQVPFQIARSVDDAKQILDEWRRAQ